VETKFELRLDDAYELGAFAYKLELYPEALEWLQTVYAQTTQESAAGTGRSAADIFKLILEVTEKVRFYYFELRKMYNKYK
jgi:hypothetical protein